MVEALFGAVLVAYVAAAVGYAIDAWRPGAPGRIATWSVRIGWLLHTALLVVQAVRAEGFPGSSWAGSLNLFVWLLASVYLVWGCRARFRLLGLAVMPLAALLFAVAALGGARETAEPAAYSTVFLVAHVGLVTAAFAGFTVAAALAGLYLWQERRLKRREARLFRRPAPSLVALDDLAARTVAVALPALTLGIGVGLVRLATAGGEPDALMAVTAVAWIVYVALLLLRRGAGWRGRRAAYLALAGFGLVLTARLGVPLDHFSSR